LPVSNSNIKTPNKYQSIDFPWACYPSISGAKYATDPQKELVSPIAYLIPSLLRPKSVNMQYPS